MSVYSVPNVEHLSIIDYLQVMVIFFYLKLRSLTLPILEPFDEVPFGPLLHHDKFNIAAISKLALQSQLIIFIFRH